MKGSASLKGSRRRRPGLLWTTAFSVACALLALYVLPGCGGGGGGDPEVQNPVVFTRTVTADASGQTIEDSERQISLVVPAGAISIESEVTLEILEKQRTEVAEKGFQSNANAINISVDPQAMADGQSIQIVLPLGRAMNAITDVIMVTDDKGLTLPIPSTYDATSQSIVGEIDKSVFEKVNRSDGRGFSPGLGLFLIGIDIVFGQPKGEFWIYKLGQQPRKASAETMGSGCTAVLIHGLADDKDDMVALANHLLKPDIAPGGTHAYDEVWIYDYNWFAEIDDSGDLFASDLDAALGAGTVDIFAHSMGGLVARWALEQQGLGAEVDRLITLGTPHEGLPLGAVQLYLFALGLPIVGNGFADLIHPSLEGVVGKSFFERLNEGNSPYRDTAKYYTVAGRSHSDFKVLLGLGLMMHQFYNLGTGGVLVECDGIVGTYSAHSVELSKKSAFWASNGSARSIKFLNHDQLKLDGTQFQRDKLYGALTPWLVTCIGDTNISVSISPVSVTLTPEESQQFDATVTGTLNQNVTWSVVEADCGTVDQSGLYMAPSTSGVVCHVKATSVEDDTKSALATVTVEEVRIVEMTVTPCPADFGTVTMGQYRDIDITIKNENISNDTLSGKISSTRSWFTFPYESAVVGPVDFGPLEPGGFRVITVRFKPPLVEPITGSLSISNNSTNEPDPLSCQLSGTGEDPVNGQIAFASDRDGYYDIYVMGADGSNIRRLTDDSDRDWRPALSPDGTKIAFQSSMTGDLEIHVINTNGTGLIRLTYSNGTDTDPAWSPDGKKIAFKSKRDGNSEIYVMNADGSSPLRVTYHPDDDKQPAWSADGLQILFVSNRWENIEQIHLMNADGSNPFRLFPSPYRDEEPSVSPSGRVAFTRDNQGKSIFATIGDMNSPAYEVAIGWHPSWSPDSKSLAYTASPRDIYTIDLDTGAIERLTFTNWNDHASWSK